MHAEDTYSHEKQEQALILSFMMLYHMLCGPCAIQVYMRA